MSEFSAIFIKDMKLALARPAVFVFMALFAGSTNALAFYVGRFFDANRADLSALFVFFPWVFVVFVPALAMDSLSAERRAGTAEILRALPVPSSAIVLSKWLTLWLICLTGLALTMSLWACLSWLGAPDHGVALSGYFGAALLAAASCALALAVSSRTSNQVLAFLGGLLLLGLLSFGAMPVFSGLPTPIRDVLADFSLPVHMVSFWRGIISFKDVAFFVLLTAFGVYVAIVLWRPKTGALWRIALAAFGVLALNVTFASGAFRAVKLDVTAGQAYTLSPAARTIVGAQDETVDWVFYFSRNLARQYPDIRHFGAQVEESLRSFADHSRGNISLSFIDPGVDNPREDAALAARMEALPTDQGLPLYMGLASANGSSIARFDPARVGLLEYDIARVLGPGAAARPAIALYDGIDMAGKDWFVTGHKENYVFRQIAERYGVEILPEDFSIADLSGRIVMLVHPPAFGAEQQDALLNFTQNGGRALVFLDPYSEASARPALNGFPKAGARMASTMPDFLAPLGLDWSGEAIVLDRVNAMPVQRNVDGQIRNLRQPAWIGLPPNMLSADEPIMAQLQRGLIIASAAALRPAPGTDWAGLVHTSTEAALFPAMDFAADPNPNDLMAAVSATGQREWLAVQRAGIIIIGDADLLGDGFYVQDDPVFGPRTQADNADFVLNALDRLADAEALLALRARHLPARRLARIERMRTAAEQALREAELALPADAQVDTNLALRGVRQNFHREIRNAEIALEIINIWLVPISFVVLGFGFAYWRRRR